MTTYNVRYMTRSDALMVNKIYNHFGIECQLTGGEHGRDVCYTTETNDQERFTTMVDVRHHGMTYTPYTENSEI